MKAIAILNMRFAIGLGLLPMLAGCISGSAGGTPATAVDPATTQPSYWLEQQSSAVVKGSDFDKLWAACEYVARDYLFTIDRVDYRLGVLTTDPLVSGQWFEPWRRDARTSYDRTESSLAAIRRTIRFEFTRLSDDTWQVQPKVLVERQAISEKRITSVVGYRSAFTSPSRMRQRPSGTTESDQGILLPGRYWYPLRRDPVFEQVIATNVEHRLGRTQGGAVR